MIFTNDVPYMYLHTTYTKEIFVQHLPYFPTHVLSIIHKPFHGYDACTFRSTKYCYLLLPRRALSRLFELITGRELVCFLLIKHIDMIRLRSYLETIFKSIISSTYVRNLNNCRDKCYVTETWQLIINNITILI